MSQGGSPRPAQGQRGHQLPVGRLPVRLQLDLPPRPARRLGGFSAPKLERGQLSERGQDAAPVFLALEEHPLLKAGAVRH